MDRMEIIRIAGYTEDEKIEIARRHLIPKILKEHALSEKEFSLDDEALKTIIRRYTREAGVRNLERELATLARKSVKELILSKKKTIRITSKNVEDFLGVPRYRYGEAEHEDLVGVVTGLAWTEVGGELLTVEGVMMPGKGRMTVTGNLRDVMKESISAAASYVRSRAVDFGIEPPLFDKRDIHVHVPEGATPKDGPSAGVAMVTADRLDHDRDPGQEGRGDDRRDHAARPGAPDRRTEGEAPCGAPRRHEDGADPRGQCQGPRRDPGERQKRARDHAGGADG